MDRSADQIDRQNASSSNYSWTLQGLAAHTLRSMQGAAAAAACPLPSMCACNAASAPRTINLLPASCICAHTVQFVNSSTAASWQLIFTHHMLAALLTTIP
jgi:hypothetical protein